MNTSLKEFSKIFKQEGTSQQERYVPALHETNDLIDDRKFQDLILYIQQYSKNLLFIDPENESIDSKESWGDFFANDPVLLIAGIASLDTGKIKQEYDYLNNTFQTFSTIGNFSELAKFTFARFLEINKWYTLSTPGNLVYEDLVLYIQSYLQKEMETVREIMLYCFDHLTDDIEDTKKQPIKIKNEKSRKELQSLDKVWKLDLKEKLSLREKLFIGSTEKEKLINASVLLDKIFENVFYVTQAITKRSNNYFDETIRNKQDHNPHIALTVTFLKLFQYQQSELNKVPRRLLYFYYKKVLGIQEKRPVPDQAYIIFELAKGFNDCLVKRGTRLSAGKDKQNQELIYGTDKDIVFNKAKVNELRNAFIDHNESGEIINYYTDIVICTPGNAINASDSETTPKMFGGQNLQSLTEIGFAIASSQFYLAKGDRNVVIRMEVAQVVESPDALNKNQETIDFDVSIIKLLLTGDKGWLSSDLKESGITINALTKIDNSKIELDFSVSITQTQAIIPFDIKLHGGNFNTEYPIVKCLLKFPSPSDTDSNNTAKQVHQLNILQQLQIVSTEIEARVGNIQQKISFNGVRDLIVENDELILDVKKPFYPFTVVPKVNSCFYIGCNDLFYKDIQTLSINIEWVLPDNFRYYYQRYSAPYDSNKFMASLSYLQENSWKKYDDISLIDVNASEPKFKIIKMNLGKSLLQEQDIPLYDNIKQNGTLKLKLNYPGFGHDIYPQLITSTVMDRAKPGGSVDFYPKIKKRFNESTFTIKLPGDINDRNGSLSGIYDRLANTNQDPRIMSILTLALTDIISRSNDFLIVKSGKTTDVNVGTGSEVMVHRENFFKRFFKKPTLDVKQEQGLNEDDLEDDIDKVADFVLTSKDVDNLIISEVNKNINKTVATAVERILAEAKPVAPTTVSKILNDEFDKIKKVINDMIAKRIASFLSTNEIPPPPYSPLISTISVNYSSKKTMLRKDGDKIFHLTLAGSSAETNIWEDDDMKDAPEDAILVKTTHLLPQPIIAEADGKDINMQGMLFIGVTDILPDQNLSLLFQIAEGTKINDKIPPIVYWFYMRHNEWIPLNRDNIVSDSTYALQTTGIMEFSIPGDADKINTFFNTAGQYWLCAGVLSDPASFPFLNDVKAQAASVTFIAHTANPLHLALPLEAGKINKIIDELPQIKKVTQPIASFNGKVGEKDDNYYIRVSERLRHKDRAINNWDYERLVLEKFPAIFKVKCLNNYCNGHFAVGHVTIVPIADLKNKDYAGNNILVPKVNYVDLKKIEDFLYLKSSPFVRIHAVNPKLERVFIACDVKFQPGSDKGFHLKKLNEDIIEFLTPWSTDPGQISFSGKIYASSIINFIDQRDYIDYVTEFVMEQYSEDDSGNQVNVKNAYGLDSLVETEVTTDHSILVSAPKHQITLIE